MYIFILFKRLWDKRCCIHKCYQRNNLRPRTCRCWSVFTEQGELFILFIAGIQWCSWMKDRDYWGTEGVCLCIGKLVATDYHEKGSLIEKYCKITEQNEKQRDSGDLLKTEAWCFLDMCFWIMRLASKVCVGFFPEVKAIKLLRSQIKYSRYFMHGFLRLYILFWLRCNLFYKGPHCLKGEGNWNCVRYEQEVSQSLSFYCAV